MLMRVKSYNCQSANTNLKLIKSLLINSDVLCLQETFLSEERFHILENLDKDFFVFQTQAIRKVDQFCGRASGGLAIFMRKSDIIHVFPAFVSERCIGMKIISGEFTYLLLNVYLNCDYGTTESLLNFKDNLAIISDYTLVLKIMIISLL